MSTNHVCISRIQIYDDGSILYKSEDASLTEILIYSDLADGEKDLVRTKVSAIGIETGNAMAGQGNKTVYRCAASGHPGALKCLRDSIALSNAACDSAGV